MLSVDWHGAPRLHTLRTIAIGARSIKTWHAFGVPSYFLWYAIWVWKK